MFFKKDPQKFHSRRFNRILDKAVKHLIKSPYHSFDNLDIEGNGVYAIYCNSNILDKYDVLKDGSYYLNEPIYIGKAVPRGWRSSRQEGGSNNLQKRLRDHFKSISQANNLNLNNFIYQYVILDGDLISSVEAEAIRQFNPLWNCVIEGFGNHNVGRNRLNQEKPEWDVLHPGRPWANRMDGPSVNEVKSRIIKRMFNL